MEQRSPQRGVIRDCLIEKSKKEDGEERERDECVVQYSNTVLQDVENVPGESVERVRGMERRCLCNSFK